MLINSLLYFLALSVVQSSPYQCPPKTIIEPCSCVLAIPSIIHQTLSNDAPSASITQQKSIVCENINDPTFDLREIFVKLTEFTEFMLDEFENTTIFDSFLLSNTTIQHLPADVFGNISFNTLMLMNNPMLTTIDENAFRSFSPQVERFETINSNLSDSETIFRILRQFENLRFLSMQNDQLRSIPENAFNHKHLTNIWFGMESSTKSQPIENIGDYAFYNVPNIYLIRLNVPKLRSIGKNAFALRSRVSFIDDFTHMIHLYLEGELLDSNSFHPTTFTRFRSRAVFLRLYNTNITYLDENVFQPFLESHPRSAVDTDYMNQDDSCDCRSEWIQRDYYRLIDKMDNRVFGYKCWDYDFSQQCTIIEV